jgi:hypothetical protein
MITAEKQYNYSDKSVWLKVKIKYELAYKYLSNNFLAISKQNTNTLSIIKDFCKKNLNLF